MVSFDESLRAGRGLVWRTRGRLLPSTAFTALGRGERPCATRTHATSSMRSAGLWSAQPDGGGRSWTSAGAACRCSALMRARGSATVHAGADAGHEFDAVGGAVCEFKLHQPSIATTTNGSTRASNLHWSGLPPLLGRKPSVISGMTNNQKHANIPARVERLRHSHAVVRRPCLWARTYVRIFPADLAPLVTPQISGQVFEIAREDL